MTQCHHSTGTASPTATNRTFSAHDTPRKIDKIQYLTACECESIPTWKMLYLTWLISMHVFSAAGLLESRDLNLNGGKSKSSGLNENKLYCCNDNLLLFRYTRSYSFIQSLTLLMLWRAAPYGHKMVFPPPGMSHLTSLYYSGNVDLGKHHGYEV